MPSNPALRKQISVSSRPAFRHELKCCVEFNVTKLIMHVKVFLDGSTHATVTVYVQKHL